MAKVSPYHTNSPEYPPQHREVHHDHDDCPDGRRIKPQHRAYPLHRRARRRLRRRSEADTSTTGPVAKRRESAPRGCCKVCSNGQPVATPASAGTTRATSALAARALHEGAIRRWIAPLTHPYAKCYCRSVRLW